MKLYGCDFNYMGLHFTSHLRSQVNGAVWKDKPYLSHFLTPILLTNPVCEPWLWILPRVYQSFRRLCCIHCMQPEQVPKWWNRAIHRPHNNAHLRRLRWTLSEQFHCRTQDGICFDLVRISAGQFEQITLAWQDYTLLMLAVSRSTTRRLHGHSTVMWFIHEQNRIQNVPWGERWMCVVRRH